MRHLIRIILLSISLLLSSVQLFAVSNPIRINESEMKAAVSEKEISIAMSVWSDQAQAVTTTLHVDLLGPTDNVVAISDVPAHVGQGRNTITVRLALPATSITNAEDPLPWYRVRYRLRLESNELAYGIVALGAITSGMFELRITHPEKALPGHLYQVRVHAANPVTRKAIAGVQVRGNLEFDSDTKGTATAHVTNSSGDALLAFQIPANAAEGGSVTLEAQKGSESRKADFDFDLDARARIIINTDKLLYQPGQSLHSRALVLGIDKHAIGGEDVEFRLSDPDNNAVLSGTSRTNEFGVANVDWELPESVALGPYTLYVSLTNKDRYGEAMDASNVRISRYDLPNFSVTSRTDHSYYLPGQNASIEVSARYLFGKELTSGSVRLVREQQGHWDSKQQRWVVEQVDEQSRELDHSGTSKFTINLADLQAELATESYRRFQDLDYAAYVTDSTTGKTEQRRFQIRLSREPLHVYISRSGLLGDRAFFYVSTYYPDGTPAQCNVRISESRNHYTSYSDRDVSTAERDYLHSVTTNRLGVAKVENLQISTDPEEADENHGYPLVFDVRDKHGAATSYSETFWTESREPILLTTDKTLYQPNDQIAVSARTSRTLSGHLIVELANDGGVLWTGKVTLHNHHGFTIIPYEPDFKGVLTISAYSLETDADNRYEIPNGSREVMFPHPSTLRVKIKPDRATYKPGDEVSAALNVNLPSGSGSASALGVVVVDKAVEERIRTDQDFGNGHYGFWDWSWWYSPASVAGVTMKDLEELDLSKPLPEGMDLVAETLLLGSGWANLPEIEGDTYGHQTESLFRDTIKTTLEGTRKALLNDTASDWKFATNDGELHSVLGRAGIKPEDVVDPWGAQYRYTYGLDDRNRTITITSAGPDKKFGTADDIECLTLSWPYFKPYGTKIDQLVKDTYASSGSYVRDFEALRSAMLARGVDLKQLRDPWGNPYRFNFHPNGSVYEILVQSAGGHGKRDWNESFSVWTSSIDYFEQARGKIDSALYQQFRSTGIFPREDTSFNAAMERSGVGFYGFLDPWAHPYYVTYTTESEYADRTTVRYDPSAKVQNILPVTRKLACIRIKSAGPDGKVGTDDDFVVANFSQIIAEQSGEQLKAQLITSEPLSGNTGAVNGVVTDSTGAVVPNANVTATLQGTGQKFTARSSDDGSYIIRNIPPGMYDVAISAPGFRLTDVRSVPVHSTSVTAVNVALTVGATQETVEVTAAPATLETTALSASIVSKSVAGTKVQIHEETFTPRLRDYFPETLYWSPSLLTDSNGRARLKFKLADNITTWKMSVLASTKNGEIGLADSEIQSFQPFFLEHDPPRVLTVGDVINLPVVVRNYTAQPQKLSVEMKPAAWFDLQQAGKQQLSVNAGESATAVFPFRATAMVKSGKQQVYASNRVLGDAIEKTLTVHPDGMEQHSTISGIVRGNNAISLSVPTDVIPGSLQARLKIYPNLLAHVTESIEAGLERPYGCGEQTISSTYPSLMLLKFYRASGITNGALQAKAERYLNLGYRRLLNYRESGGGFSYWGHGSPSAALTAYAIRFLLDAKGFVDLDPDVISASEKWLVGQRAEDGRWKPEYGHHADNLDAYIAVTLAQAEKQAPDELKKTIHEAVTRALAYLGDPHLGLADPYALAEFAIASHEVGDQGSALTAVAKLSKMATPEHGGMYWALEYNTPFYGWGTTGRIESTAMVVLALSVVSPTESRYAIDAGTIWLLQQKDYYGVWYSGQATINVLTALLESLHDSKSSTSDASFTVTVNGSATQKLQLSPRADAPVLVDITKLIAPGDNAVSVESGAGPTATSMQAVADYFVPWTGTRAAEVIRPGKAEALRLAVHFDKTEPRVGDDVRCSVVAERIGSRGWGMLIAEIGLPPGADVDRRVLDQVITASGWEVSHYDLLPDKLVLYLWPRAGGTRLTFVFRPRYGLKARTAPSVVYDYYNPEAEVSLAPADFRVEPNPQSHSQDVVAKK